MLPESEHVERVFHVAAFTRTPFTGNSAAVVPLADRLRADQMQTIARELKHSESAFVLRPDGEDHDLRLRFFTPTMEVANCGHATVAAHYVRARLLGLASGTVVRQKVGTGIHDVRIDHAGDDLQIVIQQLAPTLSPLPRAGILRALHLDDTSLIPDAPIERVDTGSAKIIVGLRSRELLDGLAPDLKGVAALCRRHACTGLFAFVLDADAPAHRTYGRNFAPSIGIPEDPVTGNGNGPLGAYLVEHALLPVTSGCVTFEGHQGQGLGRPGVVHVEVTVASHHPTAVRIRGDAVIMLDGEMIVP